MSSKHLWSGLAILIVLLAACAFIFSPKNFSVSTNSGNQAAQAACAGDTSAPMVNLTSPSNGSTVSGTISISADITDQCISKAEFYVEKDGQLSLIDTKIGSGTAATLSTSFDTTSIPNGTTHIAVRAFDVAGNQGWSQSSSMYLVTVSNTAVSAQNKAPIVSAGGPYSAEGTSPSAISFFGATASDPDGSIANISWNFGDGQSSSGTLIASHTYSASGNYTATLTVTDDKGASASSQAQVVVSILTLPTVTISASPSTITAGNSSTMSWSSTNASSCTASGGWSGTKATSGILSVKPSVSTTYSIVCTGSNGYGSKIQSATITVNGTQLPAIGPGGPYNGVTGTPVQMTSTLDGSFGTLPTYWTFGDGSSASGTYTPSHTYAALGTYTVSLGVTTAPGRTSTTTTTATISYSGIGVFRMAFLAPAAGSTLSGTVSLSSKSPDPVTISHVDYYLDSASTPFASATVAPYTVSLNTTTASNGTHTLKVMAYDAAGDIGSAWETVTISNADTTAPTLSLTSPINASTVSGTINLNATASDNVAVTKVEFYKDSVVAGNLITTDTTSPYSTSFDTTSLSNGSHSFIAKAYDAANNFTIATNNATVSNTTGTCTDTGTVAPSAIIFSAPANPTLTGTVAFTASAQDDRCLSRVDFLTDTPAGYVLLGSATMTGTSATGNVSVNTTGTFAGSTITNGAHTLLAQVFDAAGNNSYAFKNVTFNNVNNDPGVTAWLYETGRSQSTDQVIANAVKADAQGNTIEVGQFRLNALFGTVSTTSAGASDMFITKRDVNGGFVWVKRFGGTSDDYATAVTTDASGNIYVTGYFSGVINLGGADLTAADGVFGSDAFVAKYDANGNHIWSRRMGGSLGNNDGMGIALDTSGNVFVGGKLLQQGDLGCGPITTKGSSDGYISKISGTTGECIWARTFGSTGSDYVKGIAVDGSGNVTAVGTGGYQVSLDLGNGVYVPNAGLVDAFVTSYSNSGQYLWSHVIGGPGSDSGEGVGVDSSGNVFVTGSFIGATDFGGGSRTSTFSNGYIVKYAPNGALLWVTSPTIDPSGGSVAPHGLAVDSNGNVLMVGNANNGVDFGSGQLTGGSGNFFVQKLGSDGHYIWAKRSSNTGISTGYAVTTDTQRNVIGGGSMQGDVTFDGKLASTPGVQIKSAFLYKVSP